MNRRTFIASTAVAGLSRASETTADTATNIIDTNLYLGPHPFRSSITHEPAALAEKLAKQHVTQGWVGSFEALLQRDIAAVNARLTRMCAGILKPVGSIHPKLPDWRDDLRRCVEQHGMKVVRLHPNYHGYTLDDPACIELIEAATTTNMLIQIVAQMEDERTQHPLVQVKPVDLKPMPSLLKRIPEARVMVLNANRAMSMTALAGTNVWLDIAMLEGVGGIENLLKDWPLDRLVFGSFAPFFYWESAKLKLQESELSKEQLTAITHANAITLTGG